MALTQGRSASEGCRTRGEEYRGCCTTRDSAILDPGEKKIINTCREAKFLERSLEVIVSFFINKKPVGIRLD